MQLETKTTLDTDKNYWGLIVVAIINLMIVISNIVSICFNYFELKNSQSSSILMDRMMLNSLVVLLCTLIILTTASIGLLLSKSWGWKISSGYYFYSFVDAILSYWSVMKYAPSTPELAQVYTESVKIYSITKSVFAIIFSLLIFSYLLRKKIRSFFSIKRGPIKLIVIYFLISFAIFIAKTFIYGIIVKPSF